MIQKNRDGTKIPEWKRRQSAIIERAQEQKEYRNRKNTETGRAQDIGITQEQEEYRNRKSAGTEMEDTEE